MNAGKWIKWFAVFSFVIDVFVAIWWTNEYHAEELLGIIVSSSLIVSVIIYALGEIADRVQEQCGHLEDIKRQLTPRYEPPSPVSEYLSNTTGTPVASYIASSNQRGNSAVLKTKVPQKVFKNSAGNIVCPVCSVEQNSFNLSCVKCGQVFINGQSIPYWCGKCGTPGEYDGNCPTCGSSMKIFNN